MHEQPLHDPNDPLRDVRVPASQGIPQAVVITGIASVALCFIVAGLVLSQAGYNHMWPAADTLRLLLTNKPS